MADFQYVDFATKALYGFRNNVVHIGDVPRLAGRYGHMDCFCTYFLFDNGLSEYVKHNHDSVSGYGGSCYAHFLPLDVDSQNFEHALQTAKQITSYLLDNQGVPQEAIAIYYSGMKGFHVNIATATFGEVQSSTELPKIFRQFRQSIVKEAMVKHPETIDFSISDRLRLFRLPNTKHSKSGLYKVPLQMEELLSCEPEEIRSIAQKPRRPWLTDETGLVPKYQVQPIADAVEMFERSAEQAEKISYADFPNPGSFLNNGNLKETLCQAELELYREGVSEGARSAMSLRFASRFRSAGHSQNQASPMVESFAGRCRPPLDAHTARQIVTVAYRANGKGYQFGCGTGNGDPPQSKLVYERCRYKTDRIKCDTFRDFYIHLSENGKKGGRLL